MADWKKYLSIGAVALGVILVAQNWPSVVSALGMVLGALLPLVLGFVLAYVADIPLRFFERQSKRLFQGELADRLRRPICIVVAVLIVLLLVALLAFVVFPEFVTAVFVVQDRLPSYVQVLRNWLDGTTFGARIEDMIPGGFDGLVVSIRSIDLQELVSSFLTGGAQKAASILAAASSIVSVVVSVGVALVMAFSLLLEKEKVTRQFRRLFDAIVGERRNEWLGHAAFVLDRSFHGYVVGAFTGAAFQGGLCGVIMALFGMPFSLSVAVLVGITAIIPVVGPIVGMVLGAFLVFTESPLQALLFLVIIFVIQQIWNAVLYPRFVDSSLGLPGIWIMAAITVGGIGGILGMAISVPLAATLYVLTKEQVEAREAQLRAAAPQQEGAEPLAGPEPLAAADQAPAPEAAPEAAPDAVPDAVPEAASDADPAPAPQAKLPSSTITIRLSAVAPSSAASNNMQ